MSHIKIYQIRNIEETIYAFRQYDARHFNMADYKLVAETDMEIPEEWKNAPLEYVYMKFNGSRNYDFKMHSLSVSDVVELDGERHYVQGFGFKKLLKEEDMELTVAQVREKLFNKQMLELLVTDFESGYAASSMAGLESSDYFSKSVEERADLIAKHIQDHIGVALYNNVKEILKEEA